MRHVCFYHAGCPDGFGAAFAAWRAWGDRGCYIPRHHEHRIDADEFEGDWVVFVDIAPTNKELDQLARVAEQVTILDHHVTARDNYLSDPETVHYVEELGHEVIYEMGHSGAVLAWKYFAEGQPVPELLRYVEDQDLWNWQLPGSQEVNAAIAAYPQRFEVWSELMDRPIALLAREGEAIARANRMEVERIVRHAHTVRFGDLRMEAVNATNVRSAVGHELAQRKTFGVEQACVYRVHGSEVHATVYSIGETDVTRIATRYGGGGHRNAAGFTVPLEQWLREFLA